MTLESPPFAGRPHFVGQPWLRCTRGYAFELAPPDRLRGDEYLRSDNPWERMLCVTLQAQGGDFRNVEMLLDLVNSGDGHLHDCAIRVFAQAAPSGRVVRLAELSEHDHPDVRMEAYSAALLSCDLGVASALASRRTRTRKLERDTVMDQLSYMIEPNVEDLELVDSPLDDDAFQARVAEMVGELRTRHGEGVAICRGAPVDLELAVAEVAKRCADDDPDQHGATLDQLLSLIEGMTGTNYAGCLDEDCVPVLPAIADTIDQLRMSGLTKFVSGRRYFFGHSLA